MITTFLVSRNSCLCSGSKSLLWPITKYFFGCLTLIFLVSKSHYGKAGFKFVLIVGLLLSDLWIFLNAILFRSLIFFNKRSTNCLSMKSFSPYVFKIYFIKNQAFCIYTAFSALMRYKVEWWNSCSASILPARYVPHNTGKCYLHFQPPVILFWLSQLQLQLF